MLSWLMTRVSISNCRKISYCSSLNNSIFKISNLYKCLSTFVTLHAMEAKASTELQAPAASPPHKDLYVGKLEAERRSEIFREEKNLCLLPGIEPQFFGCRIRSLAYILKFLSFIYIVQRTVSTFGTLCQYIISLTLLPRASTYRIFFTWPSNFCSHFILCRHIAEERGNKLGTDIQIVPISRNTLSTSVCMPPGSSHEIDIIQRR